MIDVEALNQELPDGYEAAKMAVGGISISANDGMGEMPVNGGINYED